MVGTVKQLWPSFPEGLKVLLIDSNKEERGESQRALKQFKYEVIACEKARDGIELLKTSSSNFHIVLVEGTGAQGCPALTLLENRCGIPVIVVTRDRHDPKYLMKAVRLGAVDFFYKPLPLSRLRTMWQHVVRNPPAHLKNKLAKSDEGHVAKKAKLMSVPSKKSWHETSPVISGDQWPADRHKRFVDIVEKLGPQANPVKILQAMGTAAKGLNKHIVADYLRMYLASKDYDGPQKLSSTSVSGGSAQTVGGKDLDSGKSSLGTGLERSVHQRPLLPLPANVSGGGRVGNFSMGQGGLTVIGTPVATNQHHWNTNAMCGFPMCEGMSKASPGQALYQFDAVQNHTVPLSYNSPLSLPEELVSEAITQALANPQTPLPIGLKLPCVNGIVAELKEQGYEVDHCKAQKIAVKQECTEPAIARKKLAAR
eukprot:scaffold68_cov340-Pavlova_lutheri.AAC.35